MGTGSRAGTRGADGGQEIECTRLRHDDRRELWNADYRVRYEAQLKLDFPRVPLPRGVDLFRILGEAGHDLLALHLLESSKLDGLATAYIGASSPRAGRVGWSGGTVWLDAEKTNARDGHRATRPGTIGFHGVPEEVWDFQIGGYQVCHKWLKDRKGRTLSDEDIAHYQKIVVALNETIRLMGEIDEVIEEHGRLARRVPERVGVGCGIGGAGKGGPLLTAHGRARVRGPLRHQRTAYPAQGSRRRLQRSGRPSPCCPPTWRSLIHQLESHPNPLRSLRLLTFRLQDPRPSPARMIAPL